MKGSTLLRPLGLVTCLLGLLGLSCESDEAADGRLAPRVHGEVIVENGLSASAFADGWALRFDKFLVSIGDLRARSGDDSAASGAYRIVDLARPSSGRGQELPVLEVPSGAYDRFGYTIGPAASAVAENVSAADAAAMTASRSSIWIRATAVKGAETRQLDLRFGMKLVHDCAIDGKVAGDPLEVIATLHADHLLLDNTPESNLRLQLLADADRDGDRTVTTEELAAIDVSANPDYRVLSARDLAGRPIVNLRQYIERRMSTIGHVDGEHPCTITATP